MENWKIQIDGIGILNVDEISPIFAIQDSKASGRGENLIMFREILGGVNRFDCAINYPEGENLRILRALSKKPIVNINIYNANEGIRRTMKVSVKCEKIPTIFLSGKEYGDGKIEVSFTQFGKDKV